MTFVVDLMALFSISDRNTVTLSTNAVMQKCFSNCGPTNVGIVI